MFFTVQAHTLKDVKVSDVGNPNEAGTSDDNPPPRPHTPPHNSYVNKN